MSEQQMVPQTQNSTRLGASLTQSIVRILAVLWRSIFWIWSIFILGIIIGVLGNAVFTLLTKGKIDFTGTFTVLTWLNTHLILCIMIVTPILVLTCCSFLAHRRQRRAAQEHQRLHEESLIVLAKGVQQALNERASKSTAPPFTPSSVEAMQQEISPPKTIWNVPYRQNPFFTGREDVLQQLQEYFTQAKTAALTQPPAITGLGGIGKTQVAVEYAYRHKDAYQNVFWVNATSHETLIEGFVTIARLLALPAKDEHDQTMIVAAVQHWLANHTEWLLILDNADDSSLVTEFFPTGNTGHILLTTREQAWGSVARNFPVKKMDEPEGILFLLRRANVLKSPDAPLSEASSAEQATAAAIVKEMDGLPLALDQAGAYIEETPSTLNAYLKAYQRRHMELLRDRGKDQNYQHKPVATTWSLNFEQVKRLNPTAADLLRFLAFLAPDAIPEEMIVAGASELGPQLQKLSTDETLLDQPMKVLSRFSFVQRDTDKHLLFIHRLVQAVLRATLTPETQRVWAERTVRAVDLAFPNVSNLGYGLTRLRALWTHCERVLPHALSCAELINDYILALPEAARLLNRTGYYLIDHAQYEQAKPLYERALAIREQVLGPNHPDTAQSLNNLALLYNSQGDYEQAKPLYERALAIREQMLGPNHPDTATSLNNLAELYRNQGDYEQAKPLYERALAILEKTFGSNHPNKKIVRKNLATLLEDMKKK